VSEQPQDWVTELLNPLPPVQSAKTALRKAPWAEEFSCLLDSQPSPLVPQHFLEEARRHKFGRLIVNPHCLFSRDRSIEMPFLETSTDEMVWVLHPITNAAMPFWLGPRFEELGSHLRSGEPAPPGLTRDEQLVLAMAGVLVEPDYIEECRRNYAAMVKRSAAQFRRRGYVALKSLIHPFHLAALRRYYRQLIRDGKIQLGDDQSPRRYGAHNERVARFFHHQLAAVVSDVLGEFTKPSYVYFASYQPGSRLGKHTDREQCQYSISLCLDFTPEPKKQTPWPLFLETRQGTVKIYQSLGDGLLYRGRELPHYRTHLPRNYTSTSLFFHYVRRDFNGPLN